MTLIIWLLRREQHVVLSLVRYAPCPLLSRDSSRGVGVFGFATRRLIGGSAVRLSVMNDSEKMLVVLTHAFRGARTKVELVTHVREVRSELFPVKCVTRDHTSTR